MADTFTGLLLCGMDAVSQIVAVILCKIVVLRKEEVVGTDPIYVSIASSIYRKCSHARIGSQDILRELPYRGVLREVRRK